MHVQFRWFEQVDCNRVILHLYGIMKFTKSFAVYVPGAGIGDLFGRKKNYLLYCEVKRNPLVNIT